MCGVCVCNKISLRCRLVFVTPMFKKNDILLKGITAEPKYISQRNAYEVWMIRANKPRLTFYFRKSFELIKHSKNNITKAALSVFLICCLFGLIATAPAMCGTSSFQFKHADFCFHHLSSRSRSSSI